MEILISSNTFKNSLSNKQACFAIYEGFNKVFKDAEYVLFPIADGGEGTYSTLTESLQGRKLCKEVTNANHQKILAEYGFCEDNSLAIIESSAACGIEHVSKNDLNPLKTTTYGVGELILDALSHQAKTIIIGVGGTCTNDGGMGMAEALGVKFYGDSNFLLHGCGENLSKIVSIDVSNLDKRITQTKFIIASDVSNTLIGKNGASYIYGPQKGATKEMVVILDNGLNHYGNLIQQTLGVDVISIPGSGSGGGLGGGILSFLKGEMSSGFDIIKNYTNLENKVKKATLILTGEGKIDSQSLCGKGTFQLATLAKKYNKKIVAFSGIESADKIEEFYRVYPIFSKGHRVTDLDLKNGYENLVALAEKAAKELKKEGM